jgi:hypothetical protein
MRKIVQREGNGNGRGNENGRTRNGSLPLTALISSRDLLSCNKYKWCNNNHTSLKSSRSHYAHPFPFSVSRRPRLYHALKRS